MRVYGYEIDEQVLRRGLQDLKRQAVPRKDAISVLREEIGRQLPCDILGEEGESAFDMAYRAAERLFQRERRDGRLAVTTIRGVSHVQWFGDDGSGLMTAAA
jgi:hypothetical protein